MDPAGAVHGPVERPTGFDVDRAHARRLAEHERWAVRVDVVLHQVGMDGLEAVVDESGRVAFVDASAYRQSACCLGASSPSSRCSDETSASSRWTSCVLPSRRSVVMFPSISLGRGWQPW
jgi:hypothetical protein